MQAADLNKASRQPISKKYARGRIILVVSTFLAILLLFAFSAETIRRFHDFETRWENVDSGAHMAVRPLTILQGSIEHGGLDRHFRNYILYRDPADLDRQRAELDTLEQEINRLDELLSTPVEREAVAVLRAALGGYRMSFEKVLSLPPSMTARELDGAIKPDLKPAIDALHILIAQNEYWHKTQEELALSVHADAISLLTYGAVAAFLIVVASLIIFFLLGRLMRAHGELHLATKRIDLLIDNAPDPMICVNGDGAIVRTNRAAENFFGYDRDEFLTLGVEALLPERFRKAHVAKRVDFFQKVNGTRPMGTGRDFFALTKERGERAVDVNISHFGVGSEQLAIVGIRDVTEARQLQNELVTAKEEAESGSKAKSQFLATMSHELRSPLNVILGYSQLLQMGDLDSKNAEYAANVVHAGEHLLSLIGDIMDYSKIEAGGLELEEIPFDLAEVMREVVAGHQAAALEKGNRLEMKLPDASPFWVLGDPTRIRQILVNYLSNALKFTNDGAVNVSLEVLEFSNNNAYFRLSVSDTGIGIPAEKTKMIFDRFTQADSSTSRRFGGTGLGLAICKSLAEAMKGRVGLRSEPGVGSEFWFDVSLPVAAPPELQTTGESDAAGPVFSILLAEDTELSRRVMSTYLERLGHRVTVVSNGVDAVDAIARNCYDLVLMDIRMPILDGLEATRKIRQLPRPYAKSLPIIALTADVAHHQIDEFRNAGMSGYISKPINFKTISEQIQGFVEGSSAEEGNGRAFSTDVCQ